MAENFINNLPVGGSSYTQSTPQATPVNSFTMTAAPKSGTPTVPQKFDLGGTLRSVFDTASQAFGIFNQANAAFSTKQTTVTPTFVSTEPVKLGIPTVGNAVAAPNPSNSTTVNVDKTTQGTQKSTLPEFDWTLILIFGGILAAILLLRK